MPVIYQSRDILMVCQWHPMFVSLLKGVTSHPSCMVNLKRVQAKEYSRCRAKDFWMDAGSLASWRMGWSLGLHCLGPVVITPVLRCVAFPNPGSLLLGECVSRLVRNNTTSILNNHFGGKFYMLTLTSASTCMCMSWTNRTNIHPCLKPPPAGDTSIIRRLTFAAFARKYTCLLVDRKPSINLRFLWVSRYQLWSLERVKSSECTHQSTWPILEWYIYIPSICSKWLVSNSIL